MSLNRVAITGNLGSDPELRRTQSGMAILTVRVAVNDRRKNNQTGEWEDYCNWVDVTTFGTRAESLSNMLRKGSKIGVDGKLRYSEWERGGQKRNKLEVIADDIELLTPKSQQGGGYQNTYDDAASQARRDQAQYVEASVYDDDCPF